MTDQQKLDRKLALEQAQKVMRSRINLLTDTAKAAEQMMIRMTADDSSSAMYFEWMVNDLQNMIGNLGLAELCRTHANISHHDNILRGN